MADIMEKIASMKAVIDSIDTKIAEVAGVRDAYYNKINNQFDLINATIQKIVNSPKFQAKQEEINRLNQEIERLNGEIYKNNEQIKELKATIQLLQSQIEELKQENRAQNASQTEQYEKDKQSLVEQIQQLQNENAELKKKIESFDAERTEISKALDQIIELLKAKVLEMDKLKNVENVEINTKIQAIANGVNQIFDKLEGNGQEKVISSSQQNERKDNRNLDEPFEIKDYNGNNINVTINKLISDLNTKLSTNASEEIKKKYRDTLNKIRTPDTTVEEIQQLMRNIIYKNGKIFGGGKRRKTKKIYKYVRGMKGKSRSRRSRKVVGGWVYKSTKKLDDKSVQIISSSSNSISKKKSERGTQKVRGKRNGKKTDKSN
jgi:chromosome segregation ATPase